MRVISKQKRKNKYTYYKVIQTNHGYGWDDDDFHECNSNGGFYSKEGWLLFKENLEAYKEASTCIFIVRVIFRKERG